MTLSSIKRRTVLKALTSAITVSSSPILQAAVSQNGESKREWTGFSICDNCNQVPSCGIKFKAEGNIIQSIENWSQNPRHVLCSKGLSTLQRLYNPNRLLYPMKRTNPKGSEDHLYAVHGTKLTG